MAYDRFCRPVVSIKSVWRNRTHGFHGRVKRQRINEITYHLACGHTVVRTRSDGPNPLQRKYVHCEWCETGEEPQ